MSGWIFTNQISVDYLTAVELRSILKKNKNKKLKEVWQIVNRLMEEDDQEDIPIQHMETILDKIDHIMYKEKSKEVNRKKENDHQNYVG